MSHIFREVRILKQEGKLHQKLVTRVRILFGISLILFAISGFNVIARGADPLVALALAGIGFVLGLYVFSKMNVVTWNEDDEVLQTGKMGTVGYVTLALYICFEIGLRTFLKDFYPVSVTTFLLAGIFGTLLGRAVGTVVEIHKIYRQNHPV